MSVEAVPVYKRRPPREGLDCKAARHEQLVLPLEGLEPSGSPVLRHPHPGRVATSVAEFHRSFNLPWQRRPEMSRVPTSLVRLRENLLEEEVTEFVVASQRRDLVEVADALADIVYVAYGTALTYGIDLDLVLDEIHRSNVSKLDADGRPVHRHDGKVLKSPLYTPPSVAAVLATQPPLPF